MIVFTNLSQIRRVRSHIHRSGRTLLAAPIDATRRRARSMPEPALRRIEGFRIAGRLGAQIPELPSREFGVFLPRRFASRVEPDMNSVRFHIGDVEAPSVG